MKDRDFKLTYLKYFAKDCPPGYTTAPKVHKCVTGLTEGMNPDPAVCKKCWREYVEQQEPEDENQPGLFGEEDER